MEFSDRVGWVLLGMALGYIIRLLQDMKKEVHEVDVILTAREKRKLNKQRSRDEGGSFRIPATRHIAVGLAVLLCLYATVSTGITNNKLEDAISDIRASQEADVQIQLKLARVTVCTQEYLGKTITALNERTEFTQAQSDANVNLQKAQREFLETYLIRPPASPEVLDAALELYVSRLQAFVEVAQKNRMKVTDNSYPKPEELAVCLSTPTEGELDNPDETVVR